MVVLPLASVAVQVLMTVYSAGQPPLMVTFALVSVGVPHASDAVGVAKEGTAGHSMFVGPGKPEITGGILSKTVIIAEAVAVHPLRSVTVTV